MIRGLLLAGLCCASAGCDENSSASQPSARAPSPNASLLPAPLSSRAARTVGKPRRKLPDGGPVGIPADSAGRLILRDAGPIVPVAMKANEQLELDELRAKDVGGVGLGAHFVWRSRPGPPSLPEVNAEAIELVDKKVALSVEVDLWSIGRMRLGLTAAGLPLPRGTELRARSDRYGHVLVWPNRREYRIISPGSVRALFTERRADVLPLMPGKTAELGPGQLLDVPTTKTRVTTAIGAVELEQTKITGAGESGQLLCRFLIGLIATDPSSSACSPELTPLAARYRWAGKSGVEFVVDTITRKPDLAPGQGMVPPSGATLRAGALPNPATGVLVSRTDLTAFRRSADQGAKPLPGAPGEGLVAVNHTDRLLYVLLDGVPVAWVKPLGRQYLIGPQQGRYTVQWRDFLGEKIGKAGEHNIPAEIQIGVPPDAGAAPAP